MSYDDVEYEPADDEIMFEVDSSDFNETNDLILRVSPEYAEDLFACLKQADLHPTWVDELTIGPALEAISVAIGSGIATSLPIAVSKFFDRHKGKKILFGETGGAVSTEGFSAREVERVLQRVDDHQRELNARWESIVRGETAGGSDAPRSRDL